VKARIDKSKGNAHNMCGVLQDEEGGSVSEHWLHGTVTRALDGV
jgi:hypothetical protein